MVRWRRARTVPVTCGPRCRTLRAGRSSFAGAPRADAPAVRPAVTGDGSAGIVAITERLAGDPRCVGRISMPARAGRTADWPHWLHPDVRRAYEDLGIAQPWRHQVRTADLAWSGQHVLVATGTASGKSAAFGMPALTVALAEPEGAGRRGPTVLLSEPDQGPRPRPARRAHRPGTARSACRSC